MSDMTPTITPKSDQLNSDDMIAGPRTIKIRDVKIAPGTEQPVGIYFEGDTGKPYLPCKSMRRVMVAVWGPDASQYAGRSMTLYRDPTVTWGGMEVGGIRISHMSHMEKPTMVVLTATKKTRKPFNVAPLIVPPEPINTAPPKRTWGQVVKEIDALARAAEDEAAVLALADHVLVKMALEKAGDAVKEQVNAILGEAYQRVVEANMQRSDEPVPDGG